MRPSCGMRGQGPPGLPIWRERGRIKYPFIHARSLKSATTLEVSKTGETRVHEREKEEQIQSRQHLAKALSLPPLLWTGQCHSGHYPGPLSNCSSFSFYRQCDRRCVQGVCPWVCPAPAVIALGLTKGRAQVRLSLHPQPTCCCTI